MSKDIFNAIRSSISWNDNICAMKPQLQQKIEAKLMLMELCNNRI